MFTLIFSPSNNIMFKFWNIIWLVKSFVCCKFRHLYFVLHNSLLYHSLLRMSSSIASSAVLSGYHYIVCANIYTYNEVFQISTLSLREGFKNLLARALVWKRPFSENLSGHCFHRSTSFLFVKTQPKSNWQLQPTLTDDWQLG